MTPFQFSSPRVLLAARTGNEGRLVPCLVTGRPAPADFVDPQQADAVECGASVTVRSMGCVVLQSMVKEAKR